MSYNGYRKNPAIYDRSALCEVKHFEQVYILQRISQLRIKPVV